MECFTLYESLTFKHNAHTNRVKVKCMAKPDERASTTQHSENILLTVAFSNIISNLRPLEN
jgi:hypothetical protein